MLNTPCAENHNCCTVPEDRDSTASIGAIDVIRTVSWQGAVWLKAGRFTKVCEN